MSKQKALTMTMPWGKHKGKTLGYIYNDNKDYLIWLHEHIDDERYGDLFQALDILVGE